MKPLGLSLARCLLPLMVAALLLSGCSRGRGKVREVAYVSSSQAVLRDQVAAVYSKVGLVKNGDQVQVLDRDRRFVRVRTADGLEGWMEQRNLVSQPVYDGFQQLAQQAQNAPVQANATTRNDSNLHLNPARDAEHLYQLNQGTKLSLLKRATSEKALPSAQPKPSGSQSKEAPKPLLEDWWLIRDAQGHVGWVLGRMLDVDVPMEIAQYAEGQRMVAAFELDRVADADRHVPQYLVVLSDNKDGLLYDFGQIRVFTWNVKRHRYETAYRERNLNGVLPVTVSQENFDNEGNLPVFVLRVKDDGGNVAERKYKLNTPMVRRVLAPGESSVVKRPSSGKKQEKSSVVSRRSSGKTQ